jgi:hypothetical protein
MGFSFQSRIGKSRPPGPLTRFASEGPNQARDHNAEAVIVAARPGRLCHEETLIAATVASHDHHDTACGDHAWRQHNNGGRSVTPNWPTFFEWLQTYVPAK